MSKDRQEDRVDVEPTASAIELAAREMTSSSEVLMRIAAKMRERNDISYASDAMSEILTIPGRCRTDLLVTRPIRALQK